MKTPWSNKRVLVTGAGGFIGSHLVERLVNEGAAVRAFVHYNSRSDIGWLKYVPEDLLGSTEIILGDMKDAEAIREAVTGCHTVFHLGALISIPYSYKHPVEVVETNFLSTLNILMACRAQGIVRLIQISSSEVYGTALYAPIDEAHPLQAQSPYAASKIGADKLAESFFCAYNLPVVTVRPFNTYGPRQSARAVIPTIVTQALTQNAVHLGNLKAIRDFTYISDTVRGIIGAAEVKGIEGKTFNLGTGQAVSIGEITKKIIELVNRPVKIVVDKDRLRPERSEVMRLISNNALARDILKWEPMVSLEQGINQTIEWISENLNQYRAGKYEI